MRTFEIAVLPGDGIGAEVMVPCVHLLETLSQRADDFRLSFEHHDAGAGLYRRVGVALPDETMAAATRADAILLGAMGLPEVRYPDGTEVQPHLDLRDRLRLYAGVRPIRLFAGVATPLSSPRATEIDCVLVRESTEGMFAARHESRREGDAVVDAMRISRGVSERLFRFAFVLARQRRIKGRPGRVTCVDKANVLPALAYFRQIFLEVAREYPDVESECLYVDAAGLRLVCEPWRFDVFVTENMFGDILSDVGAGIIGGMGMAPSGDIGDEHAVFQPCHGTAPDIAGRGLANPVAMILSGAMMLDWLGRRHGVPGCVRAAEELVHAVQSALATGEFLTSAGQSPASTSAYSAAIARCLEVAPREVPSHSRIP